MKGRKMKSSKERKMERKRRHKALSVAKTVNSRQRRLDNKAKRDEIHAIDPDMKVNVVNQVAYNEFGNKIEVVNNKIVSTADESDINFNEMAHDVSSVLKSIVKQDGKYTVIEKIETRNKSAIQRLTDKLKGIK